MNLSSATWGGWCSECVAPSLTWGSCRRVCYCNLGWLGMRHSACWPGVVAVQKEVGVGEKEEKGVEEK